MSEKHDLLAIAFYGSLPPTQQDLELDLFHFLWCLQWEIYGNFRTALETVASWASDHVPAGFWTVLEATRRFGQVMKGYQAQRFVPQMHVLVPRTPSAAKLRAMSSFVPWEDHARGNSTHV